MSSSAVDYARRNYPRFLDELKALLRIPSVSTLPEHAGDCHFAAEVLAADLSKIGMENVRLIETRAIRWSTPIGSTPPANRRSWSTAITTSSPPTR